MKYLDFRKRKPSPAHKITRNTESIRQQKIRAIGQKHRMSESAIMDAIESGINATDFEASLK